MQKNKLENETIVGGEAKPCLQRTHAGKLGTKASAEKWRRKICSVF